MSISEISPHVELEHAPQVSNQASTESTGVPGVSNSSLQIISPKDHLKATISFRALVESDGHKLKRTGSDWKCCCPFHPDRTPSFSIRDDDHARCFGCGWRGDIFDYVMERTECDFCEALILLSNQGTLQGTKTKKSASKRIIQEKTFSYSEKELKDIALYTSRLANEAWLTERVAGVEKWKPETIANLALERTLGWAGDTLAFIYKTGYKLRQWPGRKFWWEAGHAHLWRYQKIAQAQEVWLCEGETDAIALIDKGAESVAGVAVVAAASATSFQPEFAAYFKGKHVTVCFDADEPGRIGAAKIHELLRPVAASLHDFNPKEVR